MEDLDIDQRMERLAGLNEQPLSTLLRLARLEAIVIVLLEMTIGPEASVRCWNTVTQKLRDDDEK